MTEDCVLWTEATYRDGYGHLWDPDQRKRLRAHRVAFEAFYGPIPPGSHVLHDCDTTSCINPLHLHLGTNQQNVDERQGRGRHHSIRQTHCAHGHPLAGDNLFTDRLQHRHCLTCRRRWAREYKARRKAVQA